MNYILFDGPRRKALLPFTFTRPVADIRVGIMTIREKWEHYLGNTTSTITEDYMTEKWPMVEMESNTFVCGSILPDQDLVTQIKALKAHQVLHSKTGELIAFCVPEWEDPDLNAYQKVAYNIVYAEVKHTWDIFSLNEQAIEADFEMLTEGKTSQPLSETNTVVGNGKLFVESGASVECAIFNTSKGSVYIGKQATVMEGAIVRGPFALCDHATVKMGAKIYEGTTIGPHSKVGGEVGNSVLFGYSNKGHDGYLGNSVLGEWCNLGADTNTSNLKNNYAEVRLWSYETNGFAKTGLQFCGLMMGDHSKSGINTMFNTGTVIGVSANIFGGGFPRNFIPSFSWGGSAGFVTYKTNKALEVAEKVMQRRNIDFTDQDQSILEHVYEETKTYRKD
ncbi:GlmU family protein [Aquimarina agarivorans]|uniref:GlmU family protein n=1 Tax=Aquimarina agarivorans TaxID=980584 RepID=UPI000248E979|nr:GlmU family protein [Aquimarina agarivorans]